MSFLATRGITSTKGGGQFFCPDCRKDTRYERKRVRQFVMVYLIPVFPLGVIGDYIECPNCKGTYRQNILSKEASKSAQRMQAEFQKAMHTTMVHMMLADGEIDDAEVERVREIYEEVSGAELDLVQANATVVRVRSGDADLVQDIESIRPFLNEHGRNKVLEAAIKIACADGELCVSERGMLALIAKTLEFDDEEYGRMLSNVAPNPMGVTQKAPN